MYSNETCSFLCFGRLGSQGSTNILLKYPTFESGFSIFLWAKKYKIRASVHLLKSEKSVNFVLKLYFLSQNAISKLITWDT